MSSPESAAVSSKGSAILPYVRALVTWMDDGIGIPGTKFRFGWDAILGLTLPGVGDAITALSQVSLLIAAVRVRAPWTVMARMVLNVAIDSLIGTIPVLGDLFDFGFKSNRKNLELIERLEQAPEGRRRSRARDYTVLALAIGSVLAVLATPFVLLGWLLGRLF